MLRGCSTRHHLKRVASAVNTIETILVILLVLDSVALTVLVLIQQGKGADIGAAFGAGGANTLFGSAGSASFLTKLTAWLAIGFFAIAFSLAYTAKERASAMRGDLSPIELPLPSEELPAEPSPDSESDLPDV